MSFRFAVWAAVSTDEQVQDHDSLDNQLRDGRVYAERMGGVESAGPYVADGYSRSFYEGLSEAMGDIPPLRAAMLAAEHNQYDVLIVRYFERLGVVAYPVFLRLGKYKKQLRSVQEPTPILPPEQYEPAKDEATSTMIHLAGLKQDYRINRIINNLRESMPRRIREGLPPSRTPYGYVYINNKTPRALDPAGAARLIQARDMLLRGESYQEIGNLLGVHRSRVPGILSNPYYAGIVAYNKTFIQRSGTKRQQVRQAKSKWITGEGKHEAIFTQGEHEEILSEVERRAELVRRNAVGFAFSGLLRCAVCGGRARRHKFGSPGSYRDVVTCRDYYSEHTVWDYDQFVAEVVRLIRADLYEREGEEEESADKSELIRQAIEANKKQRARVQDGYKAGVFDAAEAATELRKLEADVERLHKKLEQDAISRTSRSEARESLQEIGVHLEEYLVDQEPKIINRLLAAYIREIRVGERVEVVFRGDD
jgi:DNA invertase Pin-like site-specific DNA recombinase